VLDGNLPPGPKLPRWFQTAGFLFQPARWFDWNRRRYGDLVTFRTLLDPCFVIAYDPELIKKVFRGSPDKLRAGEANALLGPVVGENSLLLLDGARHLRERKLLLPPFHGERMRAYEEVMREEADRAIDSWPVGEAFPLMPEMQEVTLEVILRTVFGVDEGPRLETLKTRIRTMIDPATNRLMLVLFALSRGRAGAGVGETFESRRAAVDELIYEEIANRRDAADLDEREDVFSMFLQARDEDGRAMTDVELRDELVTLLVAGHETTSAGLAWTFELLMRNPDALERLRASLAAGDDAYLDAVVKESLRIKPVVAGVGRKVREEPFELGGYSIPVGIEINPSIAAIHRRADCYDEPKRFKPERFLGKDAPDTYTWLPFGGGTRRCIGASFALFEMKTVVRQVIERTDLVAADRRPDKGVRKGVTFVPKRGARVVMRSAPQPPATSRRRNTTYAAASDGSA